MKAVQSSSRRKQHNGSTTTGTQNRRPIRSAASPPTTVELCGIPIHFPFRPYKCQEIYMEKVLEALHRSENALLESPTGTGKTLCLLCATLAWQREQARLLPAASSSQQPPPPPSSNSSNDVSSKPKPQARVPTVIYASRTHSQLSQVVRELRNTRYRPKHAVLGSREQMCVHPKVKTAKATAADINHECNRLAKEHRCRFRNQLEGFTAPSNESAGSGITQPVMDMEDLVEMGKTLKVCPFYYTRSLVSDAELVLIPYNYLFDKDARETTLAEIRWDDAVVIFDEAHNLESFASESASFDLNCVDIAGCIGEVSCAMNYVQAMPELGERVRIENLTKLKALFLSLEEHIVHRIPNKAAAFAGEYIFEIFRNGACMTHANHHLFVQEVRKVSDLIMDMRGGSNSGGSSSKGTPKLENFVRCVKLVFGESTEARCLAKSRSYRVHVTPKQSSSGPNKNKTNNNVGRTVSYWCFAPSLAMQELAGLNLRSILVTSGTLSPLPSYSMELGLRFPQTLENPHIIEESQIHVRVIGKGVSGKLLTSTYERREDGEYIAELGNTLVSLARIIPGGMLIFFPSYGVMETCIERWGGPASRRRSYGNQSNNQFFAARRRRGSSNSSQYSFPHAPNFYAAQSSNNPSTPWKRLLAQKAVIVEPRSTSDLSDAISEFHKFLGLPKSSGCVLMGVCRGKISEGIDFSNDMCRAVVITGLPFAPYLDPKVKLKREYLDSVRAGQSIRATDGGFGDNDTKAKVAPITLSGAEWYSQQALRAVNQAIGRVIRNKSDYGAVLLLDSRFGEARNQNGLSKWLRPYILKDEGCGKAIGSLVAFYKEARRKAEERETLYASAETVHGGSERGMLLKYEDDEDEKKDPDETITNIAIIQTITSDGVEDGVVIRKPDEADMTDTPSAADADDSLLNGYVQPERVLARINLKGTTPAHQQKLDHVPTEKKVDRSSTRSEDAPSGLAALYSNTAGTSTTGSKTSGRVAGNTVGGAWSGIGKSNNSSSVHDDQKHQRTGRGNSRPSAKPPTTASTSKTSAAEFFREAKEHLTSSEFSTLRKILVAMKAHGDKKDARSYKRSAHGLINVLVRYDNYDSDLGTPRLLELLYPLLPSAYRSDIEKTAIKRKFEESKFHRLCKETLSSDGFEVVRSLVPSLLCGHPGGVSSKSGQGDGTRVATNQYLRDAKRVIEVMLNCTGNISGEQEQLFLLNQLYSMIPSHHFCVIQALGDELKKLKGIQRMKNMEKSCMGENSVQTALFRKSEPAISHRAGASTDGISESTPAEIESKRTMEAALMHAGDFHREKRDRVEAQLSLARQKRPGNPYLSKRTCLLPNKKVNRETQVTMSLQLSDKKLRTTLGGTSRCPPRIDVNKENSQQIQTQHEMDPLDRCLRQVASDAYVKKAPAEIARRIQSNVPKGLVCTVCNKSSKQPFMAKCRHTACLQCWLQWLEKSPTCPVCRAQTSKKSLARMVFRPGAAAASLSQLCASADEEEQGSSEEELEIIETKRNM